MVLAIFIGSLVLLYYHLRKYHLDDILHNFRLLSTTTLALAVSVTFLNYFVLTFYDTVGFRYVGHRLEYRRIALASFISYAFSMNTNVIGGSAVRYRIYSGWGISASDVARLVIFCGLTFWLGFLCITGLAFAVIPPPIPPAIDICFLSLRPIGIAFLGILAAYIIAGALGKDHLTIKKWQIPIPGVRVSLTQILIASADWLLAGSVLYILLPHGNRPSFPQFVSLFMLAQFAGLISNVPAGIGVFESMGVILFAPFYTAPEILASLLTYRAIYYFLPLSLAAAFLFVHEVLNKLKAIKRLELAVTGWMSLFMPTVFAAVVFAGGAILLISGATPAVRSRLAWLRDFLPLPAIEISHFLAGIVGAALLILARGLQRRIDAAYYLTAVFLAAGAAFSLLKGLDYEESLILAGMLAALLPFHREFYRKAALFEQPFTIPWIILIVLVLVCSIWVGIFSYKHVAYSNDLWWRFTLYGNAPRFLRTSLGAVVFLLLYGAARLLAPVAPPVAAPDMATSETVEEIVRLSPRTYANLALLGDKHFLLSKERNTFIMYAIEGRSWIAMGDPIGPREEWEDVIWQFVETSNRRKGWPVFYELDAARLELYVSMEMTLFKLGEEAQVSLNDFSLEGSSRKGLRSTHNKLEKQGFSFVIIPPPIPPDVLKNLKEISDAWLTGKNTREKRFSLGFFSPDYLVRYPVAVATKDAAIAAFANVWQGADKQELSVDLMRHLPDCPDGVMDYLFTELLLWGKRAGYRSFNFGMAPLAGLENQGVATFWPRTAAFLFRHGEHFYNFKGVRQYKEKFGPVWYPKYLACPRGLLLPRILANVATLISGGITGTLAK